MVNKHHPIDEVLMGLFGKDVRAALGMALVGSCSLIVNGQGAVTCEDGTAPRCDGATLVVCQEALEQRVSCSEGCAATPEAHCAVCGDGIVEGIEACDPGVSVGCAPNCRLEAICGDGILQPGEECDDTNLIGGDGCSGGCLIEFCGDGVTNNNEDCDPLDPATQDDCRLDCLSQPNGPACGDGIPDEGEACDDGNIRSGDGCSFDCLFAEGCGNGVLDVNESCEIDEGDCESCLQSLSCATNSVEPGELCLLAPASEVNVDGSVTASAELLNVFLLARQSGAVDISIDVASASAGGALTASVSEGGVNLNSPINFLTSGTVDGSNGVFLGVQDDKRLLFVNAQATAMSQSGVLSNLPNSNTIQQIALRSINEDAFGELLILTKNGNLVVLSNTTGAIENTSITLPLLLDNPIKMDTADFNGDGKTDIVIASDGDPSEADIRVFLSNSSGANHSVLPSASIGLGVRGVTFVGLVARDFDGDGDIDVVAATDGNGNATDKLLIVPNIGSAADPIFPAFNVNDTPLIDFGGVGINALSTQDINADGDLELLAAGAVSRDVIVLERNNTLDASDAFVVLARYALRNSSLSLFGQIGAPGILSIFAGGVEGLGGVH